MKFIFQDFMSLEKTINMDGGEYEIHNSLTTELIDKLGFIVNDSTSGEKALVNDYESTANPKYIILVKKHGKLAGAAVVEKVSDTLDYIDKFYVAKEFQKNGVSDNLMGLIKQYSSVSKENTPSLGLRVDKTNEKAISFYEKHGFTPISESSKFIIYEFGVAKEEHGLLADTAIEKRETIYTIPTTTRVEDSLKYPLQIPMQQIRQSYAFQN
jgi:ribosomal protein S18 acetylase RimI-like enzyme